MKNTITLLSDIIILKKNLTDLINFIYLNLMQNYDNINYMVGRAILAPKNIYIKKISDIMIDRLLGDAYILYIPA